MAHLKKLLHVQSRFDVIICKMRVNFKKKMMMPDGKKSVTRYIIMFLINLYFQLYYNCSLV